MARATSDVFRLCYWRTWNVLCLIVACSVISASAQVRCYRNTTCGGSDFFDVDTIEDCCLSDDGVLVNGTGGCETCRVFGWISGATDPNNNNNKTISFLETGERQPLVVGFSKGIPTINSYNIQLRGTVTEGTATQGATADFRLDGDINMIVIAFARVDGVEAGGPTITVPAIIQIDNVALEANEDFTLSFEVAITSPDNLLSGEAVVIVNELQVFIVDQTGVDGAIARVDYDSSTQDITFTAGPARTIQVPVEVFDDFIDEADEEYFVMFLETDDPRVDLTNGRFASRGIIRDNERTTITFEHPWYSFNESQLPPLVDDTIFIIKRNNRTSELTFTIRILAASGTAVNNMDFLVQPERREELLPNQDRIDVSFLLIDDTIPEGDESFQFEIANAGYVSFDTSTTSTIITILDNDDVVVGFEQTEFTVNESDRYVELCLAVLNPNTTLVPLTQIYSVGVETVEGTAGNDDYGKLFARTSRFFFTDTVRHNCFNVTITDDILFERNETFLVLARENPPFFTDITAFRVEPDNVTITILDLDTLTLGFMETSYAVQENASVVTVEVEVKGGSGVGTLVTLNISTMDISAIAPDDYVSVPSPSTLTFTEGGASVLPVDITIVNDNLFEDTEMFRISLTLSSPLEPELASRIFIDPENTIVSILNDDNVIVGFEQTIFNITEDVGHVELCLAIMSPGLDVDFTGAYRIGVETEKGTADHADFEKIMRVEDPSMLLDHCLELIKDVNLPDIFSFTNENRRKCLNITIVDDDVFEGSEFFMVVARENPPSFTDIDGVSIDPNRNNVTINIFNQYSPTVQFEKANYSFFEDVDTENRKNCVMKDPVIIDDPLTVNVTTTEITPVEAIDGEDFTLSTESVTFQPTVERVCTSVQIIDNNIREDRESPRFLALLAVPSGVSVGDRNSTVITITEDDVVEIDFTQQNFNVSENDESVTVCLQTSGSGHDSNITVTVNSYEKDVDNSASEGDNFISPESREIIFPAANTSGTMMCTNFTIIAIDDAMMGQYDKQFFLNFSLPPGSLGSYGSLNESCVTIIKDDSALVSSSNIIYIAIAVGTVAVVMVLIIVVTLLIIIGVYCARKRTKAKMNITLAQLSPKDSGSLSRIRGMSRIERAHKIIPYSKIRLLDSIGEGEYGIVYKAHFIKDVRSAPEIIAVKTLKQCYDMEGNSNIIQESLRMIGLDHPNVLGLIGVCIDAGPTPYLLMPYMGHGNLLSYLKKRRPELVFDGGSEENANKRPEVEKKLLGMCLQIAKGMEYLTSKKMVHCDLAARNCMMDLNTVIKVADFGLTEDIYSRNYFRQGKDSSVKLPMKWMAPESLSDCVFTEASDVWSFGVTCWEVYTGGRSPYPGIDFFTLQRELDTGRRMDKPLNAACSDEIYKMMLDCWNSDPNKRPTFSDLVVSFNTMLEQMAGYVDLTSLQSKACVDAGEQKLPATSLESKETRPQALGLNEPSAKPQESPQSVSGFQLTVDDEERAERYITTPV